ncbi:hypothetical protein PoB_007487000 [Plakobranchus ocellatus]|uniref:Uncharacterized protein n=1 Tax=Plakobranchus ocellatus TaxID=259542 RepID=A0AAV4DWG5_9GAST|nr:hypothetical protein PoB_007487000 [Plakobranchus ocellatus]
MFTMFPGHVSVAWWFTGKRIRPEICSYPFVTGSSSNPATNLPDLTMTVEAVKAHLAGLQTLDQLAGFQALGYLQYRGQSLSAMHVSLTVYMPALANHLTRNSKSVSHSQLPQLFVVTAEKAWDLSQLDQR